MVSRSVIRHFLLIFSVGNSVFLVGISVGNLVCVSVGYEVGVAISFSVGLFRSFSRSIFWPVFYFGLSS